MLLPAATVTIAPSAETIGPLEYSVLVENPTRLDGHGYRDRGGRRHR